MNVAIIGSGITGLTAAYRLRKLRPDVRVTLLEASARLGGKLLTEQVDGFVVEGSADSFLSRKPAGMALVRELGLEDQIQGRRPENRRTFVKRHGQLHRLPEGLTGLIPTNLDALMNSTLLSAEGVARVREELLLPPRPDDGTDESVGAFITRRMGQEAYENLIEPLMGGIYGGRADLLSLNAVFPQLRQLELNAGSLLKGLSNRPKPAPSDTPPFVSFTGGIQTLVDRLVLMLDGVNIRVATRVSQLKLIDQRWYITLATDDELTADAVIVTTPAYATAKLVRVAAPALADALGEIPYSSAAIATFGWHAADVDVPLDGYGYVIPRAEGLPVLACTWSSSKWDERAQNGDVLLRVYLGRYGLDVTAWSDEALLETALGEVRETVGIRNRPMLQTIHRWPNSIAQYQVGHRERIAAIREQAAALPGLHLAAAWFDGVGIPDCIRHGEAAAQRVATERLWNRR